LVAFAPLYFSTCLSGKGDGALRADLFTCPALLAMHVADYQIGGKILGLWIGAPITIQRAAFHKNGGSDSRPVVYTESLYVENQAFVVKIAFGGIHGK
jgi:hypothetical protein